MNLAWVFLVVFNMSSSRAAVSLCDGPSGTSRSGGVEICQGGVRFKSVSELRLWIAEMLGKQGLRRQSLALRLLLRGAVDSETVTQCGVLLFQLTTDLILCDHAF